MCPTCIVDGQMIRGINVLYGTPTFMFAQTNTVEGVVIHDPAGMYHNPSGEGGAYPLRTSLTPRGR